MIATKSDAPSIAIAYATNRCNDIAARTDGRTYVELLTLLCYLPLVIARRGAARFTSVGMENIQTTRAARGIEEIAHATNGPSSVSAGWVTPQNGTQEVFPK